MARHLIQNAATGDTRIVGDAALAFFPGYIIKDTYEDGNPPFLYYSGGESDLRYVNVSELSDTESAASVVMRAAFDAWSEEFEGGANLVASGIHAPEDHGAVGDGTTNDTAAVQAAIQAAYDAGGGTVLFPAKTYRINGQLVMPHDGGTGVAQTRPIRLQGAGALMNGQWLLGVHGGTVLDMRATTSPAKIDTRGGGLLQIEGINFTSGLAGDSTPFIRTTNTTLKIRDCAFVGDTTKTGQTCVQDAIVLGGTSTTTPGNVQNMGDTGAFQGYGTVIADNYFHHIRRGIWGRTWSNSVVVQRNTFSLSCGAADGTTGGIHWEGPPVATGYDPNEGVIIADNLFESAHYPYSILLTDTASSLITGNSFWDGVGVNIAGIRLGTGAKGNFIVVAFNGTTNGSGGAPSFSEAVTGSNTVIDVGRRGFTVQFGQPVDVHGSPEVMRFGPLNGAVDVILKRVSATMMRLSSGLTADGESSFFGHQDGPIEIGSLGTTNGYISATRGHLMIRTQGTNGAIYPKNPVIFQGYTVATKPAANLYEAGAAIYFTDVAKLGFSKPGTNQWVDALGTVIA